MNDVRQTRSADYMSIPVHEQSWRVLLSAVPKRLVGLVSKLIGVKIVMFAVGTSLLILHILRQPPGQHSWVPWVVWLIIYIATLFGWDGLKWMSTIAALRYGGEASIATPPTPSGLSDNTTDEEVGK